MPNHPVSAATDPVLAHDPDRQVPESVYWEEYYEHPDVSYEWNNGRLEENSVSDYLTYQVYAWFVSLLRHFLETNPIAGVVGLETGFRLALPHKVVIRKPDLGVVRNDNAIPLRPLDRRYRGIFDLCIEALSDSTEEESARDEVVKKQEYAAGGVPEYYILHHDRQKLAFYRLTRGGVYQPIPSDGGVVRSAILPGFQFRPEDLRRRPPMKSLRLDAVYRDFVLPGWLRAEQERDRAEEARDRAEQERNELLRARLKAIADLHALGLSRKQIARALGVGLDIVADVLASRQGR